MSATGLSNPVRQNTGQSGVQGDAELLLEVENQLIKDGGNWDYSELKTSFEHCDRGRTGFIGTKEVQLYVHYNVHTLNYSIKHLPDHDMHDIYT